jgi:hypothetical protein
MTRIINCPKGRLSTADYADYADGSPEGIEIQETTIREIRGFARLPAGAPATMDASEGGKRVKAGIDL